MKDFNQLCKEIEDLDPLSYSGILHEKAAYILPRLSEIAGDSLDGISIFATFILGSIVADGKLSKQEYDLMYPLLYAFFGDSVNYDDCKKIVKSFRIESEEFKRDLDGMLYILGKADETLKNDIITVCLLICSLDGKISLKEKIWIKQLIN